MGSISLEDNQNEAKEGASAGTLSTIKVHENRVRFAVWSTFRELLGWADDAGPMPRSFVAVGWLLGAALLAFGAVAVTALDSMVLGVVSGGFGVGLVFGTLELR